MVWGGFCSSTPLLGSKTRVVSGSRYACHRPVLKLKIETLGPYVAYYEAVWEFFFFLLLTGMMCSAKSPIFLFGYKRCVS